MFRVPCNSVATLRSLEICNYIVTVGVFFYAIPIFCVRIHSELKLLEDDLVVLFLRSDVKNLCYHCGFCDIRA